MNFFALFDLPESFDIDLSLLAHRYRALQREHHPDQQVAGSVSTAVDSATINMAYDTLRVVDKRAAYLLSLKQQAVALDQSIGDIDFLGNALEVREQLDEANTPEMLDSLRVEVQQWIESLSREFDLDYRTDDWPEARDTCRKLAFMRRILDDIDATEDRFDDLDDFI